MSQTQNNHKSFGFTLIELMVAIGILAILIGIIAFAITGLSDGGKAKETKVRLESLNAMLTELEAQAGLRKQPDKMYRDSSAGEQVFTAAEWSAVTNGPFDIWRDGDPSIAGDQPAPSPGPVSMDAFRGGDLTTPVAKSMGGRFRSPGVMNTQLVMGILAAMPNNRSALQNMPANRLLANPNAGTPAGTLNLGSITLTTPTNLGSALKPAILVDAWDNPILFVPAAGLRDVKFKEHGETEFHVITSSSKKMQEAGLFAADFNNYVVPPQARPFFASAGPDGDFSTGDDNVYSFDRD